MDKKTVLQENLDREIKSFRRSFERMKPADVYKCFYKINFFEEYYELLIKKRMRDHDNSVCYICNIVPCTLCCIVQFSR